MRKSCFLMILCLLINMIQLSAFADEEIVLIESRSNWQYIVVDNEGFDAMDPSWMESDFSPDWNEGDAPFGDRIVHEQANKYGWVNEQYGIFLRQTFHINDPDDLANLNFYINTFYDNTVHIYLNGTEIFADDNNGNSDWVDEYTLFSLDGIANLLIKGNNLLAVSVHDNTGGREFDLSLFATTEMLDTSPTPDPEPEPDPQPEPPDVEDDSVVTDKPAVTENPDDPSDFGSEIPFTKSTEQTDPSIITVYVTAEGTVEPSSSGSMTAPLVMMGSSLLVSIAMVVIAFLISRRMNRSGGGN